MSRPVDWKAREDGLDVSRSFIVQAPAGSGKTELLTQRMLALLARVENPEEVIAITFTRKAAAEMRHRLVEQLRAAARQAQGDIPTEPLQPHEQVSRNLALEVLKNDRRFEWDLLAQPGRLRIQTIDSLCSDLARQLPVLSSLGGGHHVADDANSLYREAASRTMALIEEDGEALQADIIRILDRYDNQYDRLITLLTGMLASRDQWLQHLVDLREGDGFNRQGMQSALLYLVRNQLETAKANTPRDLLLRLPALLDFALAHEPDDEAGLRALMQSCGESSGGPLNLPVSPDGLPHWRTMIGRLLTKGGGKWRSLPNASAGFPPPSKAQGDDKLLFKAMKDDFKALMDDYTDDDTLRETFNTVMSLPDPVYDDEAWDSLESLMRIMMAAAANLKLVMAETGELDYGEVAGRAIESLGHDEAPSELALRLDYRIQHLLVDEFQDTSGSQVLLLKRLTAGWSDGDGRSLFLVGDPMQSIYRFRKAEVSLFIEAWKGNLFDHLQLECLRLSVNFRSNRPVVDWVNRVFPSVMPVMDDPVMGAVSFSDARVKPGVPDTGLVNLHISPERDDAIEAQRVIEVISHLDAEKTCAILVRSRNHAASILAELDRLKSSDGRYRYKAIKMTPLAQTPVISDLVSLTLAVLQPADRLAWLALLRSPFIGLSLADLDAMVMGDSQVIMLDVITAVIEGSHPVKLSADGHKIISRAGPLLLEAVSRRGHMAARLILESAWISLGGPACIENDSELLDAETFFSLLQSLETEGLPLDRDNLERSLDEHYAEPDADANGKLQVLTIHSAKGLQFDSVILPGLNIRTGGNNNALLHWFELPGEDMVVMSLMRNQADKQNRQSASDLVGYIAGIENQRQRFENGRLLYVAATRAIENLFLLGAIKPTARGEIRADAQTLMESLWPAVSAEQEPLIAAAADQMDATSALAPGSSEVHGALPREYRRLSPGWALPDPLLSIREERAMYAETSDSIEFSWAGEDARLTGNLVHGLFCWIGEQGIDSWLNQGGMTARESWCRRQLATEGITGEKADRVLERVTMAVDNCLASERGRWILNDHEDAHSELAITAITDGNIPRNMALDRTFIDDGIRWIIDYKTSSHGGGDLEAFLDSERERYAAQLGRYRKAMSLTETRPIKTALYFPLLDQFITIEPE